MLYDNNFRIEQYYRLKVESKITSLHYRKRDIIYG